MKVAVVIPKYGLVGGAENFVFEVTERLAGFREFEIHVLAEKWRQEEAAITFHKLNLMKFPRFMEPISFAQSAEKIIKSQNFDIIHTHDRMFGADIFTFHGIPHRLWRTEVRQKYMMPLDRAMSWVEGKCFEHPGLLRVLPVSTLTQDYLLREYSLDKEKIRVMHPGVHAERFDLSNREKVRSETRSRFGFLEDDIVVFFASMNFELKRLDLVIEGISMANAKSAGSSRLKLLVAGRGNEKKYSAIAGSMGVESDIKFAGVVSDMEKYFAASDIFAVPSDFDTFGMVVLEAMASGLPVIISPTMGARDIVTEGVTGFVLPANLSSRNIAAALEKLQSSDTRAKMAAECIKTAGGMSWDGLASGIAGEYERAYKIKHG